jgi:PmbA protein
MMLDLLEYAVKKAEKQGASQGEAYFYRANQLRVSIEKKQVKMSEKKYSAGLGLRLAIKRTGGFSVGFAYQTDLNRKAVGDTLRQALKVASFKKPDPDFKSFQEHKPTKTVKKIYDKQVLDIEPEEIVDLAADQVRTAETDKRISTVSGTLGLGTTEVAIANSLGVSGQFEKTGYGAFGFVIARQKGSVGVGSDSYTDCFFNKEKTYTAFKNARDLAIRQLNPKSVETERMDVMLQPDALQFLLEFTLIPEVRADNVQKRQSPFVGKMHQTVASENLTVIDDALIPQARGSRPFDDEGCPSQTTTVISKGCLQGFLYNSYTAAKDNVTSTGNAARMLGGFSSKPKYAVEPITGPTNFRLSAGKKTAETEFDEVLSEVKNGVIAKQVIGAHTANTTSGEFSVVLDTAFKIKKGEILYPVKQTMLGGNILEVLKSIALFADDAKQVGVEQTLISPTILVKDVRVSS